MENTRAIYFKNRKDYLKKRLLREHEWYIYCFQYFLRKEELSKNIACKAYWRIRKNILGKKLGFYIPAGAFGVDLHIWHYGNIVVNAEAKVGKHCQLHGDNCIGNNGITEMCPKIGDYVDIGVGAKIIGGVKIANGVKIGAGAVVVKDCLDENVTLVGVPAQILKRY